MKFELKWQPVLEPLSVRKYNKDAQEDHAFQVCVNPTPELWGERAKLLAEYADRYLTYEKHLRDVQNAEAGEAPGLNEKVSEFLAWYNETFAPTNHSFIAKLLSFGEEQYSADDLESWRAVDPHFVNWLINQVIQMVEDHKTGRKKN